MTACDEIGKFLSLKMEVIMKRNSRNRSLRRRGGFTLTEVLLVLAILGVIAAMVVPNLMARQVEALKRQSRVNIATFENIAKQYAVDHDGDWPTDINAMMNPGNGVAPYLEKIPKDGWNQPLNYEAQQGADKPKIWSNGQNKTNDSGGGDDLNNWAP